MKKLRQTTWFVCFAALWSACSNPQTDAAEQARVSEDGAAPLMVFAAASMREVLSDVAVAFKASGGGETAFNFAGSNVLAQQIAAAPGADLFVAANADWIEKLEQGGHLVPNTARAIIANSLVVVAHETNAESLTRIEDLASLSFTYLAVGDPNSVPAGKYAREYLSSVQTESGKDVWTQLSARIAPAPDVRAALAMVESNPNVLGVVYRTDAMASAQVKVLFEVPADAKGAAVRYYAALVKSGKQQDRARKLLDFLGQDKGQDIFKKHGFLPLAR